MNLTEHQNKVLNALIENTAIGATTLQTLDGYAGTGKSTLIPFLIKKSRQDCVVLAPTNKAVIVLKEKLIKHLHIYYEISTIHSALYSPPDNEGKFHTKKDVEENKMVIIDEASMVSLKMYNDLLIKYQRSNIIFVGDSFQLEAIGEDAPIFNLKTHTLTEVIRYDSGILSTANTLRILHNNPEITFNNEVKSLDKVLKGLQQYVVGISKNEDSVLITATNSARVNYNKAIRQALRKPEKLDNDILMCVSNTGRYANGETFLLSDATFIDTVELLINPTVYTIHIYEKEGQRYLIVPDLNQSSLHPQEIIKALPTQGMAFEIFGDKNYNPHSKQVRRVNICTWGYAISAHKSQGSQWEKVYIDFNYCAKNWNPNRWLYTAITRASKEVFLLPSPNFKTKK